MTTPNLSEWPPERIAEVLERMERRAKTIGTDQVSYILLGRDLPSAVREIQQQRVEMVELQRKARALDLLLENPAHRRLASTALELSESGNVWLKIMDAAKDPAK